MQFRIASGLVAWVLVGGMLLGACAPSATSRPSGPQISDYDPYFDLEVNGEKVDYGDGAWVFSSDEADFGVSIGSPVRFFGVWVGPSRINFSLRNGSSEPIRIIWDESSVVAPDGSSSRVAHQGVRYTDVSGSIPPTSVPPGARIDDFVVSADGVEYSSVSGWNEGPLFRSDIPAGLSFRVFLTLEIGTARKTVDLNFSRNSVSLSSASGDGA